MKHRGMKILSLLLTLVMVLGLMPGMGLTAYAADGDLTITDLVTAIGNGEFKYSDDVFIKVSDGEVHWFIRGGDCGTGTLTYDTSNSRYCLSFRGDKFEIVLDAENYITGLNGIGGQAVGYTYNGKSDHPFGSAAKCTVTYQPGEGSGTMESDTVTVGSKFTLPGCAFDPPEGKTFKAWSLDGTEYAPGASINIGRDTTFVAVWQAASSGGTGFGFGGGDESWSGGYVTGQRAYRVSLAPMQGGSAVLVLNTGESGETMNVYPQTTVRVVPSPAPGYKLASIVWSLIDGSASYDITQSQNFVMPAMDAVVHVTFVPVG